VTVQLPFTTLTFKGCIGSHEIIKDSPHMFNSSLNHVLIFVHQKTIQLLTKFNYVFNKLNVLNVIKSRLILSVFCVRVIRALEISMYCN
jgi:hypothetical protein